MSDKIKITFQEPDGSEHVMTGEFGLIATLSGESEVVVSAIGRDNVTCEEVAMMVCDLARMVSHESCGDPS